MIFESYSYNSSNVTLANKVLEWKCQKNEIIKDIIGGGDTKRCKLKDTQEDLWVPLGACLWTFVLTVGVDHW
jgi:hypothetical protein